MRVGKVKLENGTTRVGVVERNEVRLAPAGTTLSNIIAAVSPVEAAKEIAFSAKEALSESNVYWSAPIDEQEVWAAGVTYIRSKQARMDESPAAASVYDRVYSAERPELFFKATANRVVGPNEAVRVRSDSHWSVPEPEIALILSPALKIVGYTIGNDMSARDIEGENPLYLPQAKVYCGCCALGPVIALGDAISKPGDLLIALTIARNGATMFQGETTFAAMKRSPEELVRWLGRENEFPAGAILLTGTGIVPPEDFSLENGDLVHIDVAGIGRLSNPVVKSRS